MLMIRGNVANRWFVFIACSLLAGRGLADRGLAAETDFFESNIRPVLVKHCYECHSAESDVVQGGLRVDSSIGMTLGGDSGKAVAPGEPDDSLLLAAIRYDGLEMPPDQRLPDRVIRDFEHWIDRGAAMPPPDDQSDQIQGSVGNSGMAAPSEIDWQQASRHWAYQPPKTHSIDAELAEQHGLGEWPRKKHDHFVLAELVQRDMRPSQAAQPRVWLRRVSFDLTGLPPSVEDVDAFVADESPMAGRRVVERLLASQAYAERWTRVWLDIARYAEDQAHIVGNNDSLTYPNAYRYRDWVIDAFAGDTPYDDFLRRQLAADLISPQDDDSHVALGFLGLGPKYYRRGDLEVMADEWEDRIDVVTRGLLGLTVACARCHDHKYDPIPTADYYALAGVFASTEMFNRPIEASAEMSGGQAKKPQDAVHILREGKPKDLNVMIRGDVNLLGPKVPRGFVSILDRQMSTQPTPAFDVGSGRMALANRIVDRGNPVTARVIVNRIWGELLGRPLVDTPSNFGSLGSTPSHPKLLDDLAVRFMDAGWSLKWLVREIVLSSTYGQSGEIVAANQRIDPDNRLLWRMPPRRLGVEAYRDAVLSVAGRLDRQTFGPSINPQDPTSTRRTVYSEVSRLDLNPLLARFDFPDPNAHSAGRHETTTPLQKLFLLNSPFMIQQAKALAGRIRGTNRSAAESIGYAFELLYCRPPTEAEESVLLDYVADGSDESWWQLAQALLISNEMILVD